MFARVLSGTSKHSGPCKASARKALAALRALGNPAWARFAAGYFNSGKGQYREGDRLLDIAVPDIRKLTKRHAGMTLAQCPQLRQRSAQPPTLHLVERLLSDGRT